MKKKLLSILTAVAVAATMMPMIGLVGYADTTPADENSMLDESTPAVTEEVGEEAEEITEEPSSEIAESQSVEAVEDTVNAMEYEGPNFSYKVGSSGMVTWFNDSGDPMYAYNDQMLVTVGDYKAISVKRLLGNEEFNREEIWVDIHTGDDETCAPGYKKVRFSDVADYLIPVATLNGGKVSSFQLIDSNGNVKVETLNQIYLYYEFEFEAGTVSIGGNGVTKPGTYSIEQFKKMAAAAGLVQKNVEYKTKNKKGNESILLEEGIYIDDFLKLVGAKQGVDDKIALQMTDDEIYQSLKDLYREDYRTGHKAILAWTETVLKDVGTTIEDPQPTNLSFLKLVVGQRVENELNHPLCKKGIAKIVITGGKDVPVKPTVASKIILAKAVPNGKKAVTISWTKVNGATSYVVYGARCGKNAKKIATVKTTKYVKKKLKKHKDYKYYVAAMNGGKTLAKSNWMHVITTKTHGKYANVTKITAKKSAVAVAKGKTVYVSAKVKVYKGKKHIKKSHGAKFRYLSDNTGIATVNKSGTVKGVSAGKCNVYIQAINGMWCKVSVTVK